MVEVTMSTDARADILASIRWALTSARAPPELAGPPAEAPPETAVPAAEAPRQTAVAAAESPPEPAVPAAKTPPDRGLVQLFCERVADYRARVRTAAPDEVAAALAEVAASHGARRLVVPAGIPAPWRPAGLGLVEDDGRLGARELEQFDGALTAAGLAIAETGTLVLDGGGDQGRRALTLLPDLHICVVPADRIVSDVPVAITALAEMMRSQPRPVTFISGPSATADIELRRVQGVHGPRRLEVVVIDSPSG
jgi:L-lactate dehydrogenase complex protein LldG